MENPDLSIGSKRTIYVFLLSEGVDVWRPVMAEKISAVCYRLPEYDVGHIKCEEEWEFHPGSIVHVAEKTFQDGEKHLVADRLCSESELANL